MNMQSISSPSISIISSGFSDWNGGIDFLKHIANSIALTGTNTKKTHNIILPSDDLHYKIKTLLMSMIATAQMIAAGQRKNILLNKSFNAEYLLNTFIDLRKDMNLINSGYSFQSQINTAKKISRTVLLPCIKPIPNNQKIAWIGYLFDFQHCHLPYFFSPEIIKKRNNAFKNMLFKAKYIFVNSETVAQDAKVFFGDFPAKIISLPFSPCPQQSWIENTVDVREKYEIHTPYFMISNQFWKHKDHTTAFLAFHDALKLEKDITLICTGNTFDHRFPNYFSELRALIQKLNIQHKVKILGHIPKNDQISLMKYALAVIQPTLFEGGPGGGSAFDAIALGVPVISSNIPVNLEINCGNVTFFEATNYLDLSNKILNCLNSSPKRKDAIELLTKGIERKINCGKIIINAASIALQEFENAEK